MKKNQYLVIVFILTIVLVSCENYSDKSPKIKIGFSQSIDNDIWRKSMDHAMEVEASLHPGVSLTIYNANRQASKQISDIQKFIDTKMDVIIVSPFESDSIVPVIEQARAKGIPVIIVDRKANTSEYTAFLESVERVTFVTKFSAEGVKITFTSAPFFTKSLTR